MSTYYKIVCDETKLRCHVASVTSGVGPLGDSRECLPTFLVAHHRKTLRVAYEHEENEFSGEGFTDWLPQDNDYWKRTGQLPEHGRPCEHRLINRHALSCDDCYADKWDIQAECEAKGVNPEAFYNERLPDVTIIDRSRVKEVERSHFEIGPPTTAAPSTPDSPQR